MERCSPLPKIISKGEQTVTEDVVTLSNESKGFVLLVSGDYIDHLKEENGQVVGIRHPETNAYIGIFAGLQIVHCERLEDEQAIIVHPDEQLFPRAERYKSGDEKAHIL